MLWYKKLKRKFTLSLLAKARTETLLRRSEQLALNAFQHASSRVPAYRELLSTQGVNSIVVNNIDDFRRVCPLLNKGNTFERFALHELCRPGAMDELAGVMTSSGHGARFGYGFSTRKQNRHTIDAIDLGLEYAFNVDSNKTLLINCLPMGVRFSSDSVTVAETSVREDMAVALATEFGRYYQQLIFAGDPLFFKLLTDYARDKGVAWREHRIHLIIGEETFGEYYRDYLAAQFDLTPDDPDSGMIGSSMGVGELGLNLFYETVETIHLRRLAHRHPQFLNALFGSASTTLPMLFVYNPLRCYVEITSPDAQGYGDLTISMLDRDTPMPMLRYQTGDIAKLFTPVEIANICKQVGVPAPSNMILPMMALKGRNKDQLPDGTHVGQFKDALYRHHELAKKLTGAFRLEYPDGRVLCHVQLRRGFEPDDAMQQQLAASFPGSIAPEQVRCWCYDQFPYGMTLDYERKFNYYMPQR